MMKTPPSLIRGDRIGFVAPARTISPDEIKDAIRTIENRGLVPVLAENLFQKEHQLAGYDEQRAMALQKMLDDPDIKAVLAVRGGYGSVRIVDKVDFTHFQERPKWLVGYSDFTVFLNHVAFRKGVETLHATMPINFKENSHQALNGLFDVLQGKRPDYNIDSGKVWVQGQAEGRLAGGNLSVLYSLLGSPSFPDLEGAVLFLEDLDEYLYHVDRMIMALKRAGKLEKLDGLVLGAMTAMHDNTVSFGKTAVQIIVDAVEDYGYPVVSGFPAGHIKNNLPLIIGAPCRLKTDRHTYSLSFG
jgi:muramoyltetrapeptide carboxypeptidase